MKETTEKVNWSLEFSQNVWAIFLRTRVVCLWRKFWFAGLRSSSWRGCTGFFRKQDSNGAYSTRIATTTADPTALWNRQPRSGELRGQLGFVGFYSLPLLFQLPKYIRKGSNFEITTISALHFRSFEVILGNFSSS